MPSFKNLLSSVVTALWPPSTRIVRQAPLVAAAPQEERPKGAATMYRDASIGSSTQWLLTASELRNIYRKSPPVRRSVDAVANTVSALLWEVIGENPQRETIDKLFGANNLSDESFKGLLKRVVTDVLVVNKGVMYIARNPFGEPLQLYSRDGATFRPIYDPSGILLTYLQDLSSVPSIMGTTSTPLVESFTRDEIIYIDPQPKTYADASEPIIEAIVNAIAADLNGWDRLAHYVHKNELPPGFLVLGKIGEEAYERAKEQWKNSRTQRGTVVFDNVEDAGWHQMAEALPGTLQDPLHRARLIIYSAFGLLPPDGLPTNISDDLIQAMARRSELVPHIAMALEDAINDRMSEALGGHFQFSPYLALGTREVRDLTAVGLLAINEGRRIYRLPSIPGADRPAILNPQGLQPVGTPQVPTGDDGDEQDGEEGGEEDTEAQQDAALREDLVKSFVNSAVASLRQDQPDDVSMLSTQVDEFVKQRNAISEMFRGFTEKRYAQYRTETDAVWRQYVEAVEKLKAIVESPKKVLVAITPKGSNTLAAIKQAAPTLKIGRTEMGELFDLITMLEKPVKGTSISYFVKPTFWSPPELVVEYLPPHAYNMTTQEIIDFLLARKRIPLAQAGVISTKLSPEPLPKQVQTTLWTQFKRAQKSVERTLQSLRKSFLDDIKAEYSRTASLLLRVGYAKVPSALRVPQQALRPLVTEAVDDYVQLQLGRVRTGTAKMLTAATKQVFQQAKLVSEVQAAVAEFGTSAFDFVNTLDAFWSGARAFGETALVAATKVYNSDKTHPPVSLRWVSLDTETTCPHCRTYSTNVFAPGDLYPEGRFPRPQMWLDETYGLQCGGLCRCTLVPVEGEIVTPDELGRSFIARALPVDRVFDTGRLTALMGIRLAAPVRNIIEKTPGLQQYALYGNVDGIAVLPKREITEIVQRGASGRVSSRFSIATDRGTLIYLPKEYSVAERTKLLAGELATSVFNSKDTALVGSVMERSLRGMQVARAEALKQLEQYKLKILTKEASDQFTLNGIFPATVQEAVARILPYSQQFYRNPVAFYRTSFEELTLDYARFQTHPWAHEFQGLVTTSFWDTVPYGAQMGALAKEKAFLVPPNVGSAAAEGLFETWVRSVPKKYRAEIRQLARKILATPGLMRREYYLHGVDYSFKGPTLYKPLASATKFHEIPYGPTVLWPMDLRNPLVTSRGEYSGGLWWSPIPIKGIWNPSIEAGREFVSLLARHDKRVYAIVRELEQAGATESEIVQRIVGGGIIATNSVEGFAHELGHSVWHLRLTTEAQAAFRSVYRLSVAAESQRLTDALAALTTRLTESQVAHINNVIVDLRMTSQQVARRTFKSMLEFVDALDKTAIYFAKAGGGAVTRNFRWYAFADPLEWFADMFARFTITPNTFRRLDPQIALMYEKYHRQFLLGESILEMPAALQEISPATNEVLALLSGTSAVDVDALEHLLFRILSGEFGEMAKAQRDTLLKIFRERYGPTKLRALEVA